MNNKNSIQLDLQNTYAQHLSDMGRFIQPTEYPNANWLIVSPDTSNLIGLSEMQVKQPEFLAAMSGQQLLPGFQPLAQKYTGHQFGQNNPDLGDGRGILLGEVCYHQQRWDIHVKGAGQTPYSRFGDGRAVLRSSIREFLASEALHHLGIPTSRALGIFTTGERVNRETIEPGAALIRLCQSHIRFGHFEYAYFSNNRPLLERLLSYTMTYVLPNDAPEKQTHKTRPNDPKRNAEAILTFAVRTTAEMLAQWQAFGFCHGVMNSDNMSILGLTFDFGPYAFMDGYDPAYVCNHSDHTGRYAFDQQPGVALWNLNVLAHAFSPLLDKDALKAILAQYEPILMTHYSALMREKLGLFASKPDDSKLLSELLAIMQKEKADYSITWRSLSHYNGDETSTANFVDLFVHREAAKTWLAKYQTRLEAESSDTTKRLRRMLAINPKYLLRNYLAKQAIDAATDGDVQPLTELFNVLKKPYDEQPEFTSYAKRPPDWAEHIVNSCSS